EEATVSHTVVRLLGKPSTQKTKICSGSKVGANLSPITSGHPTYLTPSPASKAVTHRLQSQR
ncbi:hypothetical protein BaRGS_00014444, partial [Batillaria attramentaria]